MDNLNLEMQLTGNKDLFYSGSCCENRCIGHLRGDFGRHGDEFWTSWWPHSAHALNTPSFKSEFQQVVTMLRLSVLACMHGMRSYLQQHPNPLEDQGYASPHGYLVSTASHDYYIRCIPVCGEYNFYIYCYTR